RRHDLARFDLEEGQGALRAVVLRGDLLGERGEVRALLAQGLLRVPVERGAAGRTGEGERARGREPQRRMTQPGSPSRAAFAGRRALCGGARTEGRDAWAARGGGGPGGE